MLGKQLNTKQTLSIHWVCLESTDENLKYLFLGWDDWSVCKVFAKQT